MGSTSASSDLRWHRVLGDKLFSDVQHLGCVLLSHSLGERYALLLQFCSHLLYLLVDLGEGRLHLSGNISVGLT